MLKLSSILILGSVLGAQTVPDHYHSEAYGDPHFLLEDGWKPLLNGRDLSGWKAQDAKPSEWFTAKAVYWRRVFNPVRLDAVAGQGDRIVNGKTGRTVNLVSEGKFGDAELYMEFLLAKGSNSGVYVHGLYEIQIFDSYGAAGPMTVGDCGGVYESDKSTHGRPPSLNACLSPGQWQSLHIWFRAPRFDSSGRKTENAKFLRVLLNGALVQENVELPEPTRGHMAYPEAPQNPLMLQGDHSAVAYRSIWVRTSQP